jgi:endonuclease YncB( thermonuclease family)
MRRTGHGGPLAGILRLALAVAMTGAAGGAMPARAGPASSESCPPEAGEPRAVTRLIDPATLALDDAREVRLLGLLAPSARDVPGGATSWLPAREAEAALETLLASRRVRVPSDGAARDRYGRQVAHVFADDETTRVWLQAALVESGHARVAPLPGQIRCLGALLTREAVARAMRKGLWQNPAYAVRQARDTRGLLALQGTFQIVEGRVAATGTTRREVFLNFGRDWRWDFTAAVDLRRVPDRDALTARLKSLQGRNVRVRGWLVRRNGPFLALATPDAIEELPEGIGTAGGR